MFFRRKGTVIAEGLNIRGNISADGLVEVNGHIEGDVRCKFLLVSAQAVINGGIEAECVAVNGRVEGPIRGSEVVLKSRAHVLGDIQHQSLCVEPPGLTSRAAQCTRPSPMCEEYRTRLLRDCKG